MSGLIDEIFSPERLHKNWISGTEKSNAKNSITSKKQEVIDISTRLETLINKRFSDKQNNVLNIMTGDLKKLITKKFAKNDVLSVEDKTDIDKSIIELLDNIESLVEAFEL